MNLGKDRYNLEERLAKFAEKIIFNEKIAARCH